MLLPSASEWTPDPATDHLELDVDDRACIGINGYTEEQRLGHLFHLECVLRAVHRYQSMLGNYVDLLAERMDALPTDR